MLPESIDLMSKLAKLLPESTLDNIVASIKNGGEFTKADYAKLINIFEEAGITSDEVIKATKFNSFRALKKYLGNADNNHQWHHIVEQCQSKTTRSGFDINDINTVANVKMTPNDVHKEISRFYSQKHDFTNGLTFRDWLNGKSFSEQTQEGLRVRKEKMIEGGYDINSY